MTVSKEVLVDIIKDQFEDSEVTQVEDEEKIKIQRNMQPYQVSRKETEPFQESIETLLMYHTEKWVVDSVSKNRVEGYICAVILKSGDVENMQYNKGYDESRW